MNNSKIIIDRFTIRDHNINILLERCAKKYNNEKIKNMEINTSDRGNDDKNLKMYSMTYNKNIPELEKYCGPDFTFIDLPYAGVLSLEQIKNDLSESGNLPYTIAKVAWFGNINSPLNDIPEYKTRPLLKEIGDANQELFEIVHVDPNIKDNSNIISDLTKYKTLIDIGGNGYSGRLKFLLFSKRPLIIIDRIFIEYWHNYMEPWKHYIPVKEDLSDLLEKTKWVNDNYDEAVKIAKNAYTFAIENFTEDKISERIYEIYNNMNK